MLKRILSVTVLSLMFLGIVIPISLDVKKDKEFGKKVINDNAITNVTVVSSSDIVANDELQVNSLSVNNTEEQVVDEIVEETVSANDLMMADIEDISSIENKMEWYIEYKKIVEKYSDEIDRPETVYDYYSAEEIKLVQRMVETECYQRDFMSKVGVASVAFNRYESGKFGKTLGSIIKSPNQFVYGRTKISEDTVLAVEYAFEIEDPTHNALYFHSGKKTSTFNRCVHVYSDGSHHFYAPTTK